jgi:ATP/maltotriose-dependent transcriptional regulator MalT
MSIMFIGIVLIAASLFWILLDRKQAFDYSKGIKESKAELLKIMDDAEAMMEELNKFSGYIVEQMDAKNQEMNLSLKKLDERLMQLDLKVEERPAVKESKEVKERKAAKTNNRTRKVSNGDKQGLTEVSGSQLENNGKENIKEFPKHDNSSAVQVHNGVQQTKTKEKVVPLKGRYKEVLRLLEDGVNETEIAKKLNIGKGEIQLILGMSKAE